MTDKRYERMSDVVMREKSSERKKEEATQNIEKCFSDEGRLSVTQSPSRNDRVRAFIPDEDGYAGWVENASYTGIVKVTHEGKNKYLAERHFPHGEGKPTYLWEFTPETGELLVSRQDGEGDTPQFDLPVPADAEHEGYFLRLTQDMSTADSFNDYEVDSFRQDRYTFKLDDLQ